MRPTDAERREHDASARTLLSVEEATRSVLDGALRDLGRSPRVAAEEFERRLREIYAGARRAARVQSRIRATAELLTVRDEAERFGISSRPFVLSKIFEVEDADRDAAVLWSRALAKTFRRRVDDLGMRPAITATRRPLELSAQAVTADAWADERERVLEAAEREETAYDFLPAVGRLWDARLDACKDCRGLDLTMRPIGIDFPGGAVPGRKHWRCRCAGVLVFAPVYLGRSKRAA